MKNWKIPGIILPLLYFGGDSIFSANGGMGTKLFNAGIILILLILSMTLRWHTEKTTYTDSSMTKVITDRWNGSI